MRVTYSHYGVTQKQIADVLQKELNEFKLDNIGQILNGRTIKIEVTLDHPLMVLAGAILFGNGPGAPTDVNAMFPRVAVIDASHRERDTTIGEGIKSYSVLKSSDIIAFKNSVGNMKERMNAGMIITDQQINTMLAITEKLGGEAVLMRQENMQDVSYYISVWGTSVNDRIILTQIVEATLFGLKPEFVRQGFKLPQINTDTGIVNNNFGRMLFGCEIELTGINTITNYTLFEEKPLSSYGFDTFPKFVKFGDENFDPYEVWAKEEGVQEENE